MTDPIPIGILTRNRPVYLDATIKSMKVPEGVPVTIYDDASDDHITKRMLTTSDLIDIQHKWPKFREWIDEGLGFLKDDKPLQGIDGSIDVVSIGLVSSGVVDASCQAIIDLFEMSPGAPAVILLQDDIILDHDWYDRITARLDTDSRQGIVAGMHLDYADTTGYYTAQCYMITREFFEAGRKWFMKKHRNPKSFDVQVCGMATKRGFGLQLMYPYICQHIGVRSEVRPGRMFKTDQFVRMGLPDGPKMTPREWDGIVIGRKKVCLACEHLVNRKKCRKLLQDVGCSSCGMWNIRHIECPENKWP